MDSNPNKNINETIANVQWQKIGVFPHHGMAIPLFSLHSNNSAGIGEYTDLIPLIDWCKTVGFDVIQLLPLNDTGQETSPYSSLSAFALNPIHLGIASLPSIEKVQNYNEKIAHIRQLNDTPRVQYRELHPLRRALLREWFAIVYQKISRQKEFRDFIEEHRYWIHSYSLFKSIKERQGWKSWEEWPDKYKNPKDFTSLNKEFEEDCKFHELVQFFCFQQMKAVKAKANQSKVFIKGDIPILINRDSTEVWCHRNLFLLDVSAGSPPDQYAQEGQYWGFPVYNWDQMKQENYEFWKQRLKVASQIYDLYRLDHVVGFFRIWAIPLGHSGKEGKFLPSEENEWIEHGKKILEMMLRSSPMLPIAEDLGTVPPSVRICLLNMGVCGTKMMRWERKWEEDGSFILPSMYPKVSMTTVSTHDSDTLQLWWQNAPQEAKLFCEFKKWEWNPILTRERHKEILETSHQSNSLFHINLLNEYLALFPELVSAHLEDERINIPGKVLDTNWTYRFRPSVENLIAHDSLRKTLQAIH